MNPEESDPEDPDEIPEKLEFDIPSEYFAFFYLWFLPNTIFYIIRTQWLVTLW